MKNIKNSCLQHDLKIISSVESLQHDLENSNKKNNGEARIRTSNLVSA